MFRSSPRSMVFSLLVVCILGLLSGVGCRRSTMNEPLRIGLIRNDVRQILPRIARDNEFVTAYGCRNVTWTEYDSASGVLAAVIDGSCDIGFGPLFMVLQAASSTESRIRVLSPVSLNGFTMVVGIDHRYDSLSDLVQSKIAIPSSCSLEQCLMLRYRENEKISLSDPDSGFVVSSFDDMTDLLLKGEIGAAFLPEPIASEVLLRESLVVYTLSEKIFPDHVNSVCFTSEAVLSRRSDAVASVLLSLFEASDYLERNQSQLASLAKRYSSLPERIASSAATRLFQTAKIPVQDEQWYLNCLLSCNSESTIVPLSPGQVFSTQFYLQTRKEFLSAKQEYYSSLHRKKGEGE